MKEIDRLLDEIPTANKRNIEFLFKFLAQLTVEEVEIFGNTFVSRQKTSGWFDLQNNFEKHKKIVFIFTLFNFMCVTCKSKGDEQDVNLKLSGCAWTQSSVGWFLEDGQPRECVQVVYTVFIYLKFSGMTGITKRTIFELFGDDRKY